MVYFIYTVLWVKFTLKARNKKSLPKASKLRATRGLRRLWELCVSKVDSSTPPLSWDSPFGGPTTRLKFCGGWGGGR